MEELLNLSDLTSENAAEIQAANDHRGVIASMAFTEILSAFGCGHIAGQGLIGKQLMVETKESIRTFQVGGVCLSNLPIDRLEQVRQTPIDASQKFNLSLSMCEGQILVFHGLIRGNGKGGYHITPMDVSLGVDQVLSINIWE